MCVVKNFSTECQSFTHKRLSNFPSHILIFDLYHEMECIEMQSIALWMDENAVHCYYFLVVTRWMASLNDNVSQIAWIAFNCISSAWEIFCFVSFPLIVFLIWRRRADVQSAIAVLIGHRLAYPNRKIFRTSLMNV